MTPVIDSAELVRLSRTSIADENADERPRGSVPPRQAEASLLQRCRHAKFLGCFQTGQAQLPTIEVP